jgi:tetratricopeptide (TPR) repeat protein
MSMRPGTLIVREGGIRFMSRLDKDERGDAFWIYVRLDPAKRDASRQRFIMDFIHDICGHRITVEGGDFEGWDWQLLATSDKPRTDLTNRDQERVSAWLRNRAEVQTFELGPIVEPAQQCQILRVEKERQEGLLKEAIQREEREYFKVDDLIKQGDCTTAMALCQEWITRLENNKQASDPFFLSRAYGLLGVASHHAGDMRLALTAFTKARGICLEAGDTEGVGIYQANIEKVKACQSPSAEAAAFQVILRDGADRRLAVADLKDTDGKVKFQIVGGISVPPEASRLHEQGRRLGQEGKYDQAIELYELASQLAPDWPNPIYDAAWTYLLEGDGEKAMEYYAKVNEMAPRGFFTALAAVDTLRREQAGIVREGTYRTIVQLEGIEDRAQKRIVLQRILQDAPQLPVAWKELALLLDDDEASLEAISKGLSHQPDPETKGILLFNRAGILYRQGKKNEAIEILGQLALDPRSTLQIEHLARTALASYEAAP